jgi:hypothetical protein
VATAANASTEASDGSNDGYSVRTESGLIARPREGNVAIFATNVATTDRHEDVHRTKRQVVGGGTSAQLVEAHLPGEDPQPKRITDTTTSDPYSRSDDMR